MKKQRKGLFGKSTETSDPAPWEVETEIGPAAPTSKHDRNVPTASRLAGAGSKARMAAVGRETGTEIGRVRSADRISAISTSHDALDQDDPWAESAGADAFRAGAPMPPPPSPVPPDPVSSSIEAPKPESDHDFGLAGEGSGGDFNSDSFWGEPEDAAAEAPHLATERRADRSYEPPRFEGQSAFDMPAVAPEPSGSEFLGAAGTFDMDVGFTHDSVADMGLSTWGESESPLGLASDDSIGGLASHDPFAPARSSAASSEARREEPRGHDMSYPDIPTLTVDDALSRGSELLEAGQAEDALAILEMGLRMEPRNAALKTWVDFAERKVLADILPEARGDRVLRLVPPTVPAFADPRDAKLAEAMATPRTFAVVRSMHSGMSMREFAGRLDVMISMKVLAWDE